MRKQTIRNVLLCAGAYYLSTWIEVPAILAFAPVTNRLTFSGDFEGTVVMPIILGIPSALVMAITGAVTVWAVESERPMLWALLPAVVYGASSALSPHWVQPPDTAAARASLAFRALFPAGACIIGAGALIARLRRARRAAD